MAGKINRLARIEENLIRAKAFRAMGQIAATPHVRWHAPVASEYAVVVINLLYPDGLDKVKEEREFQIELTNQV